MLNRIVFIALGFLAGIGFAMLSHAVEVLAKTSVCRILYASHGSIDLLALQAATPVIFKFNALLGAASSWSMVPRMALYRNGYRIRAVEYFGNPARERIHFINPLV